jgi:uncharacterized protein (TIGR00730 family)
MTIKSVCIFCASSAGNSEQYRNSAFEIGEKLAINNLEIVYGGGKVGLMGAVADGGLSKGGKVLGIIPSFMTPHEVAHKRITELLEVKSMHERKLEMHERSDAVLTLPGGFGTFEELFEIVTWIQLGLYQKPVAILNTNGYYNALKMQLETMKKEGLLKAEHHPIIKFCNSFEEVMEHFKTFKPIPSIFEMKRENS